MHYNSSSLPTSFTGTTARFILTCPIRLVSSATSGLSFPKSEYVSIRELADHLLVKHHSAVGLVDRLARRGLVRRSAARADGRRVEIRLTARGEKLIQRISAAHLAELRHVEPELRRLFEIIDR